MNNVGAGLKPALIMRSLRSLRLTEGWSRRVLWTCWTV